MVNICYTCHKEFKCTRQCSKRLLLDKIESCQCFDCYIEGITPNINLIRNTIYIKQVIKTCWDKELTDEMIVAYTI